MGEDERTDMQGFRLAALQFAWRLPIAAAAAAAGVCLLHLIVAYMESKLPEGFLVAWGLLLCVGVPTGVVQGMALARGMLNRTGLSGPILLVAIYGVLVLIHVAVYFVATAIAPEWQRIHFYLCATIAAAAMVHAAKRVLTS
jgi:hypothetical protein